MHCSNKDLSPTGRTDGNIDGVIRAGQSVPASCQQLTIPTNSNVKGNHPIKTTAGTSNIHKYFITTQRGMTSPDQVPDTYEVRDNTLPLSAAACLTITGRTASHACGPTGNECTPHRAFEHNRNNHPSNRNLMPFGEAKMPSELLDDSSCDHTTDTTDNNLLDTISTLSHHMKTLCDNPLPSNLDILVELEGDMSATGVYNRHQSDDRDVSETERIDSKIRDHTDKPLAETLDGTINPSNSTRTSNPDTENWNAARIPNTRVRKRARGVSSSPNRTDKKTLVENGVL